MTRRNQLTTTLIAGLALCAAPAMAVPTTTTFGSDNDGYGGFTADNNAGNATPVAAWSLGTQGAIFTNDPAPADPNPDTGQVNSSLLKEFTFDRTAGNSYTITGVVDWTSGAAADNARVGISLFATSGVLAGIDTGLSLQVNIGNSTLSIRTGVNGGTVTGAAPPPLSGVTGADLIGETLIYTAEVSFVGADIEIEYTLSAPDISYSQTISETVVAADYLGEYFGFGSRARVRNGNDGLIFEAKTFEIVPEPASLALMGLGGLMVLGRRRRA